jgi:peptide/nickel transport system permease protein
VRAGLATFAVVCLLAGPVIALAGSYHVLGTDRTGNDVLYQSLKSVRTAFVIGTLATMATLPFAIVLGVLAGYLKGWVDEAIQYVYTTLTSVPNVLLIAACVLMVQVYLDQHADMFETGSERSDLKIFLLCVILGLTGWATLCRLIRGETLKLRELDFVQAGDRLRRQPGPDHGAPHRPQRDAPGADHDGAELFRADPLRGGADLRRRRRRPVDEQLRRMINLARSQMSDDPVVWWSFVSAFVFMVTLVLAAEPVRRRRARRLRSARPELPAAAARAAMS